MAIFNISQNLVFQYQYRIYFDSTKLILISYQTSDIKLVLLKNAIWTTESHPEMIKHKEEMLLLTDIINTHDHYAR